MTATPVSQRRPTAGDLDALPLVLTVSAAADLMSMSTHTAYERITKDAWPTPVIRFGRVIRIPTAPLLALLCLDGRDRPEPSTGGAAMTAEVQTA